MTFASGNKKAFAYSERSGLRFPYVEMIKEPGTNLWIHISESDGMYNRVDHPQGKIKSPPSDAIALERPSNRYIDEVNFLVDEFGNYLVYLLLFGVEEKIMV